MLLHCNVATMYISQKTLTSTLTTIEFLLRKEAFFFGHYFDISNSEIISKLTDSNRYFVKKSLECKPDLIKTHVNNGILNCCCGKRNVSNEEVYSPIPLHPSDSIDNVVELPLDTKYKTTTKFRFWTIGDKIFPFDVDIFEFVTVKSDLGFPVINHGIEVLSVMPIFHHIKERRHTI